MSRQIPLRRLGPALAGAALVVAVAVPAAAAELRGRVLDATGAAVAGARVQLAPANGRPRVHWSGPAGEFRFDGPFEGALTLVVSHPGLASVTRRVEKEPGLVEIVLEPARFSDAVTVSVTPVETPVTAIPHTVTIVERSAIDEQMVLRDDLAGVLEATVPGFASSLRKLTGRAETLRGRNPLYTINGVPQHNPLRDGQRDGHTIDVDFVERVEVVHGSNALQGIGATGGVVNLVTKRPRSDGSWTHDVRVSVGASDGFEAGGFSPKLSYLAGKRFGRVELSAGASLQKRGLFFDASGTPIGLYPTQGDIMDSTSRNFYVAGAVDLSGHERLEFTLNDFELRRDGDYVVVLGDRDTSRVTTSAEGDPRPLVGDPARNDAATASLTYRNGQLLGGQVTLSAYFQDFAALFEGGTFGGFFRLTPEGEPFLDQSRIDSRKLGARLLYTLPAARPGLPTPTLGLDLTRDRTAQILARSDREWVPETTLADVAPYVQLQWPVLERLSLSGGLRWETAALEVDDYVTIAAAGSTPVAGGAPRFDELLPNAGLVFDAGAGISLYGSFSEGFTMPDAGRVLRDVSTPGLDVDSLLALEPIVTDNRELGADLRREALRLHVAWYRSTSDLGSVLRADPNGFFRVSRQPTEVEGVDATADVRIGKRLSLGGTYAWLKGRYDTDADGAPETDLDGSNIAPNRLNLYVTGRPFPRLDARLQVSTFFDRDFAGPGTDPEIRFEGFTLADLILTYDLGPGRLRLGVENLLDEQYLTWFSQTEPFGRDDTIFAGRGRSVTLGFEARF